MVEMITLGHRKAQLQIVFSKPDPTNPSTDSVKYPESNPRWGWLGLACETSFSRKSRHRSVQTFLVETKICSTSPKLSSHYVTRAIKIYHRARNLKPRNLILGASSSFSRKFPPTKITRYTVVPV